MWEKGDDVGLRLTQQDDTIVRTEETLRAMLGLVERVVGWYGFKLSQWGSWPAFRESAISEKEFVDRLVKVLDKPE